MPPVDNNNSNKDTSPSSASSDYDSQQQIGVTSITDAATYDQ